MTWKRAQSVFAVAYPIYIISRIIGFMPFSIECDDSRSHRLSTTKITIFDIVWMVLAIGVQVFFIVITSIHDFQSQITDSRIAIFSGRMTLWVGYLMAIIAIFLDFVNRRRIWEILVRMDEFDEQLIEMGAAKFNFTKQRFYVICWYLCAAFMIGCIWILSVTTMSYFNVKYSFLFYVSYILVTINTTYLALVHIFMILAIKCRFNKLNKQFRYETFGPFFPFFIIEINFCFVVVFVFVNYEYW